MINTSLPLFPRTTQGKLKHTLQQTSTLTPSGTEGPAFPMATTQFHDCREKKAIDYVEVDLWPSVQIKWVTG